MHMHLWFKGCTNSYKICECKGMCDVMPKLDLGRPCRHAQLAAGSLQLLALTDI